MISRSISVAANSKILFFWWLSTLPGAHVPCLLYPVLCSWTLRLPLRAPLSSRGLVDSCASCLGGCCVCGHCWGDRFCTAAAPPRHSGLSGLPVVLTARLWWERRGGRVHLLRSRPYGICPFSSLSACWLLGLILTWWLLEHWSEMLDERVVGI